MSVPMRFLTLSGLSVASDWANCARFKAALRSEKERFSNDACCGLVTLIAVGARVTSRDCIGAITCFAWAACSRALSSDQYDCLDESHQTHSLAL